MHHVNFDVDGAQRMLSPDLCDRTAKTHELKLTCLPETQQSASVPIAGRCRQTLTLILSQPAPPIGT